jgi:galactose mutarotase-like enzyme
VKNTIASDKIVFVSDSFNVEPWVLRFKDDDINYFWRPESLEKLGTAICFPLLGFLPDNRYSLDGREYTMPQHGFAAEYDYRIAEQTGNSVTYEITDNAKTLTQFPWKFRFRVAYSVRDATLRTEYRVKNLDSSEMYFSVGGHPRFACPIGGPSAGRFEDYYVEFERSESPRNIVKSYGPVDIVERAYSPDGRRIRLDYRMFAKGCFCIHPVASRRVTLKSDRSPRSLTLSLDGLTHLQLWTAVGGPFLAIEPWYGSITSLPPRSIESNWKERPGTLRIAPGAEYAAAYDATIAR